MGAILLSISFAAMLSLGVASVKDAPKQLEFRVKIFQGDPLGSREEGSLEVLCDSKFVTAEKRRGRVFTGQELSALDHRGELIYHQIGIGVEATGWVLKNGRVYLDISISHTTSGKAVEGRTQLNTETARSVGVYTLDNAFKLRLSRKGDKQTWAEVVVTVPSE
jgi:hypothetical protein